jgi:hypothetical protein
VASSKTSSTWKTQKNDLKPTTPQPKKRKAVPEINLSERLVWVRYEGHLWPAILYNSYEELEEHIYDEIDTIQKAQLTMAVMQQLQRKNKTTVARLLGRKRLEVVEVDQGSYIEFYWLVSSVLPKAVLKSSFHDNTELFLDFHRALDEVEGIIKEATKANLPSLADAKTWQERALNSITNNELSVLQGEKILEVEPTNKKEQENTIVPKGEAVVEVEVTIKKEQETTIVSKGEAIEVVPKGQAVDMVPECMDEMVIMLAKEEKWALQPWPYFLCTCAPYSRLIVALSSYPVV